MTFEDEWSPSCTEEVLKWTEELIGEAQAKAFETISAGGNTPAPCGGVLCASPEAGGVSLGHGEMTEGQWRLRLHACPDLAQLGPMVVWGMVRGYVVDEWLQIFKSVKPLATSVATTSRGLCPLPVDLTSFKAVQWPLHGFDRAASKQAWCGLVTTALNLLYGEVGPFPSTRGGSAVKKCLSVLGDRVERFLTQDTSPGCTLEEAWDSVKNKHINYGW